MDMNLPQSKTMIEKAFGVERVVLERDPMDSKSRLKPIVNPASWAMQEVKDQACHIRADAKAFTGRGNLHELRLLLTELDKTVEAMKNLAEITKQYKNSQMYLNLHVKSATGLTTLRWRERNGACRHVPWPEALKRINEFSGEVEKWYRDATEQALTHNEWHKECRRAIATARKVVLRTAPAVYARPITFQGEAV